MIRILPKSVFQARKIHLCDHLLLSLDETSIICLQSYEASFPQLSVVDMMVGLSGEHSLHKILDIAKDNSETFGRWSRAGERFDLNTLHDGGQALPWWAIEDCLE